MKIAEVFNEYFANITDELGLNEKIANLSLSENIEDPIEKAVHKYKNQPSIKKIKQQWSPQTLFELRKVTTEDVATQLRKLKSKNPHQSIASLLEYFKNTWIFLLPYFKIVSTSA